MSDAKTARELVGVARTATLATIALRPAGHPYASLVAVAADDRGRPLLLLSKLAEHTKNLDACPKASILVAEEREEGVADPLAGARVTVLGSIARVPDGELEAARATFLAAHPEAETYVSFADFAVYRLEPEELRIVAGFGRMSWIPVREYSVIEIEKSAKGA